MLKELAAPAGARESGGGWRGVQLLWWAARFLSADLSRDYSGQRRWLSPAASAFGAAGREQILEANWAAAESGGVRYSLPWPVSVDVEAGQVLLMFEAWKPAAGPGDGWERAYRGTDLMVFQQAEPAAGGTPGLLERIVTINHADLSCYSPTAAHL